MAADDDRPMLRAPLTDRDHAQGAADAPVTLIEYGDYECPHCGRAYPIIKDVQRRLGDRLRFVFRNFPLSEAHPHAEHAAEAAEAAASQGQYWAMHDALFEHQRALGDTHLVQYAAALGLDPAQFEQELASHVHARHVHEPTSWAGFAAASTARRPSSSTASGTTMTGTPRRCCGHWKRR